MTETPRPPKTLTPARLEQICEVLKDVANYYEVEELFQHIDALTAEVAELRDANARLHSQLIGQSALREAPLSKEPTE